jgi:hypothetical protein
MRIVSAILLFALSPAPIACASSEAQAVAVRAEYSVKFRGLPIGSARLKADMADGRYSVEFSGRVGGLARLLTDMRISVQSSGEFENGAPRPAEYGQRWVEDDDSETIRMQFADRRARDISIAPPIRKPERYVPVETAHMKDVLDPASAAIWPAGAGKADICDRTLPLFDGRRRFDLDFRYAGDETFTAADGSYSGPAVVCAVRYRPIAGHRPGRKTVKFMAANEDMEVWMAPLADDIAAPAKIRVRSEYGMVELQARHLAAR